MPLFSSTDHGFVKVAMVFGTLVAILTTVALISQGKKQDSATPAVHDDGWEEILGV